MSLKRSLNVVGKTQEKHKTFPIPTKEEITKTGIDCNESVEAISYKRKFIDSMRFMTISLSNLVDNLAEKIRKINSKDCGCFL